MAENFRMFQGKKKPARGGFFIRAERGGSPLHARNHNAAIVHVAVGGGQAKSSIRAIQPTMNSSWLRSRRMIWP